MKCPKCQGNAIEIRGEYFCSQCGSKIDLNEVKEHIEGEMAQVKESTLKEEPQKTGYTEEIPEQKEQNPPDVNSEDTKEEPLPNASAGLNIPEPVHEEQKMPEPKMPEPVDLRNQPVKPELEEQETPKQENLEPKKEAVSHPLDLSKKHKEEKKEKAVHDKKNKPKKEVMPASYNIKVLLVVVVSLNILVLLGIIYFFVIK